MVWHTGKKLKDGQYIIERILGQGGFGITYLAKDTSSRQVAIKTLNDDVKNSPYFEKLHEDFQNEAKLLQRFVHPNIVKVYDLFLEKDSFFGIFNKGKPLLHIVMEYISEGNLSERVRMYGLLPEAKALRYVSQIGKVLTFIHTKNILHRDIKPDNIMVKSDGTVVLIDFGIARSFIEGKTQTLTEMGTPAFAPPEQFRRQDKRSACADVYALAATLYFCLTGSPPQFDNSSKLKPAKQLNSSISGKVNHALQKGMEFKPEDRPQSVQEWLQMLGPTQPSPSSVQLPLIVNPWIWVQWSFLFWVCLSLAFINLPTGIHEKTLEIISGRSSILAFLAFFTALFAPITEFGKVFRWRPVFVALIAAFLGSSVASVEPTYSFWGVILAFAFSGYLIGFFLGVPSVILGIAKRDLQAYFNRFITVAILLGASLSAVALNWIIFAYPFP